MLSELRGQHKAVKGLQGKKRELRLKFGQKELANCKMPGMNNKDKKKECCKNKPDHKKLNLKL